MAAFRLAVEQGIDAIELDVHLSADSHLVVIHDPTVDRTTDGHGYVKDMTVSQLRRLRSRGEPVPLLEEVLEAVPRQVLVAVEVKNGPIFYQGIEHALAETLHKYGREDSSLVISFDHLLIKRLGRIAPKLRTGLLFVCHPASPSGLAKESGAAALLPHWAYVTRELVEGAHRANVAVFAWVADDQETVARLVGLGVDGIASNFPDRLLHFLGR